ncbi:AAA family ATPase [Bifidobacterium callimiconis]|uniref:Nuclease SbcCD subunit C n=1 Tax=Bifidobacterium callimiconis TaxID=2306973 RepID=A0A430FDG6_9BIFI|nr:AAA family ATPase [Bifidobacterium callimiconis]RSX50905.1 AAA domain-containing protein [Bifidobacterium callimiconis]
MKLIGMRFKGIGPYEQEYSIDFAALNRSHMFLIEGETGAGKSTILDCISFALYGDVSVDVASKDRLRSRFLGTDQTPSYVELIFELNDAFYRVRREPAYERRKKRGEGTVSVNAKGVLWKVDDGLEALLPNGSDALDGTATRYFDYAEDADHHTVLASQARDTGTEILRLLHLTRDQFSKTVMLAQGQFSGFLRCKPEERTQLIKSLFEADVYESIQKTLDEMRKAQADDVTAQRRDVVAAIRDARSNAEAIERRVRDVDADGDGAGGDGVDGADGDAVGGVDGGDAAAETDASAVIAVEDERDGSFELGDFDFESAGLDLDSASFDFGRTDDLGDDGDASAGADAENSAENDAPADPLDVIRANWCLTDDGDLAEPAMSPSDIADALDRHVTAIATASADLLERSHDALTMASTRLDNEQRRLDAMRRLSSVDKAYRDAVDRRDALERRRRDIDAMRDRLRDSASAEPVARAQRELNAVQGRRAESDAALQKAKSELDAYEPMDELTAARERENAVAAGRPAAEANLRAAKELGVRAGAARAAWNKADRARSQVRLCEDATESARATLRELDHEATEAELRQQLEDAIRREATRSGLQDRLQSARTVLDHARKRQTEEGRLVDLQTAVERAMQRRREADDAYTQARRAFFAAGAARLAGELADGQPCPVCGSVDHPHPAVQRTASADTLAGESVPDEARLNQLDQAARRAAQHVTEAEGAVAVCKARIEAETEQSQDMSVADAEAAVAQARKELDGIRELGKERARLEARLQKLHDAGDRVAQCEHRADVAKAEASGALELARAAVESCAAAVQAMPAPGKAEASGYEDAAVNTLNDAVATNVESGTAAGLESGVDAGVRISKEFVPDVSDDTKSGESVMSASDDAAISDELAALAERIDDVAERAVVAERAANDVIAVCERAAREVDRIDQKIKQRNALEQRVGALAAALQEIKRQLSAVSTAYDEALAQSGFETVETALAACLDTAAAQRLQSEIDRFDRDDHATQAEVRRTLDALRVQLASDIVRSVLAQYAADAGADDGVEGDGDGDADGNGMDVGADAGGANGDGTDVGSIFTTDGGEVSEVNASVAGDTVESETTPVQRLRQSQQSRPSTDEALESLPEPDRLSAIVRELESTVRRAESDRDAAIRMEEQDRNLDVERERTATALRAALDLWVSSSARFVPVRDMALLAGGRAGSLATGTANEGLSLVTYAVTERFRDVLDRANEILRDIKGGVYELRLGAHEGRTAKTGLPIEVFDRRSDLACEATTLSGGETFFVSLALALALADIIQAENGGISMDTLFIDEGFGSLSEEYLDDVLDVLRAMSRHRDIGVISHVGQLKDQIAERISVTRINEDSASRLTVTV